MSLAPRTPLGLQYANKKIIATSLPVNSENFSAFRYVNVDFSAGGAVACEGSGCFMSDMHRLEVRKGLEALIASTVSYGYRTTTGY